MPRRGGFTLIELLIVMVIIGILATVAIQHFYQARNRALVTAMANDLRNFATQQELYFAANLTYANDALDVKDFTPSTGVTLTVTYGATDGWAATVVHTSVVSQCGLFTGNAVASDAPPATRAGSVECS